MSARGLVAQAAQDTSRNVWVPLLSALLGAVVGAAASLTGSVLVRRWELKKTTRIRMYDELMPALYREFRPSSIAIGAGRDVLQLYLSTSQGEADFDEQRITTAMTKFRHAPRKDLGHPIA